MQKKRGLYISFSTNGMMLNEEYVRRLIESQVDKLIFSIDGINFEKYHIHRQASSEEKFNNLIEMCKLLNSGISFSSCLY